MIRLDPSRRDEAIAAGWVAYESSCPGMYDKYIAACDSWQVIAVTSGTEVVGALFAKDGVIHLGIVPKWRSRWASRRLILEMLAHGKRTRLADDESDEFIARIGFRRSGDQYEFQTEGNASCHS